MGPKDIAIIAVIVVVVGFAVLYIYRAKKNGVKCIGCPDSKQCSKNTSCCSGCSSCTMDCPSKKE